MRFNLSLGAVVRSALVSTAIVASALLMAASASAETAMGDIKDDAILELSMIKEVFENGYAPTQWKNKTFGWDLETEFQKAKASMDQKQNMSISEYRGILTDFLRSTKDYHVGISFHSTEKAILPMAIAGAQGRYFIVWIDRTKLSEEQFPFKVGDEVLEFGGEPIAKVVADLKTKVDWSVAETDEALAQQYITRRRASRGSPVPQGLVEIKVKQGESVKSYQMVWEYTAEEVPVNQVMGTVGDSAIGANAPSFLKKQMVWAGYKDLQKFAAEEAAPDSNPNLWTIGGKKSWVPALGTKIWESDPKSILDAYIFRSDGGKVIGYVRIPSYMGGAPAFKEFKEVIKKFESATDALVIDEVNNPGGSLFYIYALTSVLTNQTSFNPRHQTTLIPSMVQEAVEMIKPLENVKNDADALKIFSSWMEGATTIDGYPVNYELAQFALHYARFVKSEWMAGKTLTAPYYLWAVDRIMPDKEVNYSKPILVLANELCFSGGDFFPATLQDNKRAKIFGTRTSGAGGYVDSVSIPSRLGLESFSYTGSIAYRLGNEPIENLGVTPDITYQLTPDDFMKGYALYKAAVNSAIADLLATPTTPISPPKP